MTVEDVSARTRIRRTIISEIERDDYSSCGGDFYARGHIRAIAKVVGTDPAPLIVEYDESVAARETDLAVGPDPEAWLQAEGRSDPLLWHPPAAGAGPDTWGQPPAAANGSPPAAPGSDTAPQPVVPAGSPRGRSAPAGADRLRDAAAGAGRAGSAAVRRAAGRLREVRLEMPGGTGRGSGQGRPDQLRGAVTDLRRAGTEAVRRISRLRTADQGPSRIIGGLAIMLAALILVLYGIFSGPAHGAPRPAKHPASTHPSPAHSPAARSAGASSGPPRPAAATLRPARVAAFGPGGVADGDNGQRAALALTARSGGWHTNWYTTARFGGLQSGTGLLLDMGRTVALSWAMVRLGPAAGAVVQLRAGSAPALGALRPAAQAISVGGTLVLRPAQPARGRYVLIWFTRLPPDKAGTYQATIDGLTITGFTTP